MHLSRRQFLTTSFGAAAAGLGSSALVGCRPSKLPIKGRIAGANAAAGHLLRSHSFPAPVKTEESQVVIVGGGIAGLAAARQLQKHGVTDFLLLELESELGGNSVSGQNAISAFPWGAHYVPLPDSESAEIIKLFEELGMITGRDPHGRPVYQEEFLCADPMERLFIHGRWQEGAIPNLGLSDDERRQQERFFSQMEIWKKSRGADGRWMFAIPVDESSRDSDCRALDQISMAEYMDREGWTSQPLRWYVNYCCRDDYGAGIKQVSAWAGIHYFASRRGEAANAASHSVLTWPEGNGWIVQRLKENLRSNCRSGCVVWNIDQNDAAAFIDYYNLQKNESIRIKAQHVVFAAPRFVAQRVIQPLREQKTSNFNLVYSPWLVANLTLKELPQSSSASPAWDNIIYESPSLGYVVATHQHLHPYPKETVITYYRPLDEADPIASRSQSIHRSYGEWCEMVLSDLAVPHPKIDELVTHLDVWIWGHAMVRPIPGFVWGADRQRLRESLGRIAFAHSDMSGISIFEEAFTNGIKAANQVATSLKNSSTRIS